MTDKDEDKTRFTEVLIVNGKVVAAKEIKPATTYEITMKRLHKLFTKPTR